ncbi:uncharacterized protein CcaverHIS019_0302420 [Cutaneotrichosporon cavernicola]|uniref:Uncharacterized protein n=1 Tax=Cutaneotrichosporon cavernicola TaxID=279322 RepID=A0AA48L272_9TREE|nr:uncharacterized protein CcaverHIS019_0302420 [Cutaneotrichosporon cavernicola]BEI90172.1 hypothetical protein CcaverHIS019_0302420 [Cutaneotrichosporon cavernicola]BEI97950.1 hypothetical protein CcaverHIS631_0302490 [Cutaneotrichosporon cavernicola]BEJ05728.1 hypothetical protein CcaverHIS641_0302500 [Cutaneotrichosporon cavernicola]
MRLSLIPVLLCTALCPSGSTAQQDAAQAPHLTGISAIANNVWQTVINGGSKPVDLAARAKSDAETGMTRITDDNYDTIFSQSRPDDLWVVAVHGREGDVMSHAYLETQSNASSLLKNNATLADKVERIKFGRLDWMTDWVLSTRWVMTKPPYIVFVTDSGKTLRFAAPPRLPANGTMLYEILAESYWRNLPPWDGSLSPDGDLSYLVEAYISANQYLAQYTALAPKWIWFALPVLTTAIGQQIMAWLHSGGDSAQRQRDAEKEKPKSQ